MNQFKITNLEFIESIPFENRNLKGGQSFWDADVDAAVDADNEAFLRLGFPSTAVGVSSGADAGATAVAADYKKANATANARALIERVERS